MVWFHLFSTPLKCGLPPPDGGVTAGRRGCPSHVTHWPGEKPTSPDFRVLASSPGTTASCGCCEFSYLQVQLRELSGLRGGEASLWDWGGLAGAWDASCGSLWPQPWAGVSPGSTVWGWMGWAGAGRLKKLTASTTRTSGITTSLLPLHCSLWGHTVWTREHSWADEQTLALITVSHPQQAGANRTVEKRAHFRGLPLPAAHAKAQPLPSPHCLDLAHQACWPLGFQARLPHSSYPTCGLWPLTCSCLVILAERSPPGREVFPDSCDWFLFVIVASVKHLASLSLVVPHLCDADECHLSARVRAEPGCLKEVCRPGGWPLGWAGRGPPGLLAVECFLQPASPCLAPARETSGSGTLWPAWAWGVINWVRFSSLSADVNAFLLFTLPSYLPRKKPAYSSQC